MKKSSLGLNEQFARRVVFKAIQRVQLRFRLTIEAAVLDANELNLQRAPSPSRSFSDASAELRRAHPPTQLSAKQ